MEGINNSTIEQEQPILKNNQCESEEQKLNEPKPKNQSLYKYSLFKQKLAFYQFTDQNIYANHCTLIATFLFLIVLLGYLFHEFNRIGEIKLNLQYESNYMSLSDMK